MKKIYCIGELLVDFIGQTGQGIEKSTQFAKLAGGAPANVAAAVAKLGGAAAFMGQVGDDSFGRFLLSSLAELGININLCTSAGKTTLAFVALDRLGERDFEFYRGSDGDYQLADFDLSVIEREEIIHFGSATALLGGRLRSSYFQLLEFADSNNNFISFDPNYRENLVTPDLLANYLHDCKTFISYADVLKLSESEAQLISGEDDLYKAATYLQYVGAKNIIITLGARGALICNSGGSRIIPSRVIQAVDTTGAGDAFMGALLFKLAQHPEPSWDSFIAFANLVGAFTCTNYGAIRAMPTMRQFLEFIN
jgi:fructokinase